jgi:hypothetical protein
VNAQFGTSFDVGLFSQLLGWVLGVPSEGLGLWRHVVDPGPLLSGEVTPPPRTVGAASRRAAGTIEVPGCCPKPTV